MKIGRVIIAALLAGAVSVQAGAGSGVPDAFAGRLLAAHNHEREAHGIAPLAWSPTLEAQAAEWAEQLAASGRFEHSRDRRGAGENLWMGTEGYFGPEQMIGTFLGEGDKFHPGVFPDVSSTGRWADVGHYSQLIWPATREVGCALASGHGRDVLVCRYYPAGNLIGARVP